MKNQQFKFGLPFILLISTLGCRSSEQIFQMEIPYSVSTMSYLSSVDNKILSFAIPDEIIKGQSEWSPEHPLPISMDKIAAIAKSELPKYQVDPKDWSIQSVSVDRIRSLSNGPEQWIYIVSFHHGHGHDSDYINLPIVLNGKPIQGKFL